MRLGVITTSYPRRAGDPAGGFVEGHVTALRGLGHDVDVIAAGDAPADPGGDTTPITPHVVRVPGAGLFYRGGAPDHLERAPLRGLARGAVFTARLLATIAARASRWDAIIAHWLAPSALAALPTARPLLAIAHGGDVHLLRRLGLLAPALHALHLRRARLVFVTEQLRALARAAAPQLARWLDAALVQPMGLPLARLAGLARAPTDPPAIFIASRLVPLKGIDVAISALDHLRAPARLVIAGDGPERAALAHRAGPQVSFLGAVDTTRRDELLREAAVVAVPSRVLANGRSEGAPLIALEALAAGVPVVASAVGGLRELAALHLVPPDDPRRLAAAIDHTLAAPPPPAMLRRAVAHLDWPLVARRLLP